MTTRKQFEKSDGGAVNDECYGAAFFQAMSERTIARFFLKRIDERWTLHERIGADDPIGCRLFVVDRRVVVNEDGLELRLGVSFGANPFLKIPSGSFFARPDLPGQLIFGVHVLGTRNDQIALYDKYVDAREANEPLTDDEAWAHAESILNRISDSEYAAWASEDPNNTAPVKLSDRWRIEDFEIVDGECL